VSIHYSWVAVVFITVGALNVVFYSCVQIDICFYFLCILPEFNHFLYDYYMWWSLTRDVHHNQFIESCTSLMWINRYLLIFGTFLAQFLSHLLIPWCRVILDKLSGLQLVKKFPCISRNPKFHYRTHKYPHLSLSWASPNTHTSWRSILILFQVPIFISLCMQSDVSPRNAAPPRGDPNSLPLDCFVSRVSILHVNDS